jgi:23S rRNA (guanosine2251-2'-O)-methyltransferase
VSPDRSEDALLISGRRAVTEALEAGGVLEVSVAENVKNTEGMRTILRAAADHGVKVRIVPRERLDAMAPSHQGVVARLGRTLRPLSERDIASFSFADDGIVVVLEGITDPQNLGACARTSEAAGAQMLVSRTVRAADVTPAAIRASAGALLHLPHARVANIPRALGRLQEAGFFVAGLAGDSRISAYAEPCPPGRVAVVIGSEDKGLSRLTRERCDALVRLPMSGRVASLNASAALAATLYGYVLPTRLGPATDPGGSPGSRAGPK